MTTHTHTPEWVESFLHGTILLDVERCRDCGAIYQIVRADLTHPPCNSYCKPEHNVYDPECVDIDHAYQANRGGYR